MIPFLVTNTKYKPHKLHIESIKYVKASAQCEALKKIEEKLTDEEKDIIYSVDVFNGTEYDFVITNTHVPAVTDVSVAKVWVDDDNRDGLRSEIVVNLYANGVFNQSVVLNDGNIHDYCVVCSNVWDWRVVWQ